ncbi:MAG TPA: Flp family type IVb pilin [bacterium]|nr:Flp family type IVb pilin [bacterium]
MGAHTQGRAGQGGRERTSLWNDEAGQGMIEYALIGGIVILGAVAVLTVLSKNLGDLFTTISNTLAQY